MHSLQLIGLCIFFYFITAFQLTRSKKLFIVFVVKLILCAILISITNDKAAIKEVTKAAEQGISNTFYVYYLFVKFFSFLGIHPRVVFSAISIISVFLYSVFINRISGLGDKVSVPLLLLNFYPDVLYFSVFSLRDIGIATILSVFVVVLFFDLRLTAKERAVYIVVAAFFALALRPELLIFLIAAAFLKWMSSFHISYSFFKHATLVALIPLFLYSILPVAVEYVGWDSSMDSSADELLRFIMDQRYERQFKDSDGSGGTTPTIPPDLYYSLDTYSLILVLFLSFIYISLSPENNLIVIAAITGLPILYYLFRTFSFTLRASRTEYFYAVLLSFIIYAPFMVNGGNCHRMRLSLLILSLTSYILLKRKVGFL